MSFRGWMAARQLLTEEFFGALVRENQRIEDAQYGASLRRINH